MSEGRILGLAVAWGRHWTAYADAHRRYVESHDEDDEAAMHLALSRANVARDKLFCAIAEYDRERSAA